MTLSYRTRQRLRSLGKGVLTVSLAAILVLLCGLLWLRRFVVYTDGGVVLEFTHGVTGPAQIPQKPAPAESVPIIFDEDPFQEGLTQLSGYYLDPQDLMQDPSAVRRYLETLPEGTPVMVDLKGYRGYLYYPSNVGLTTSSSYDMEKMRQFLAWLTNSNLYTIARISSLRDFDFAYHDAKVGLTLSNGTLYSDRGVYGQGYWLNPGSEKVQDYLMQLIRELRSLGFDEVVLQNFCYPDADDLVLPDNPGQVLSDAAGKLIATCRTEKFTLSFSSTDPGYIVPDGCRLYLEDIAPVDAHDAWEKAQLEEKYARLVFLTSNSDTRFDIENGILRLVNIIN